MSLLPGRGGAVDPRLADTVTHLAATNIFALLGPQVLTGLAPLFAEARYSPGQVVAREGDVDGTLWVVISGGIALDHRAPDGRVVHVGHVGYGGVLGERGVFAGQARETNAVALQPSVLLHADRDALWTVLRDDPDVFDRLVLTDDVRDSLALPTTGDGGGGERTLAVVRRHPAVLMANLVLPFLLVVVSLAVAASIASFARSPWQILALAMLGLGIPVAACVYAYLDYWYDMLILTNRRVIHLDKTPLIRSRRAEAPLTRVQDVLVVVPGVAARSMDYGTIQVQTAGTQGAIEFDFVRHPEELRARIFEAASRASSVASQEKADAIAERLGAALRGDDAVVAMPGVGRDAGGDATPGAPAPGDDRPLVDGRQIALGMANRLHAWLPVQRLERPDGSVVWRKHWWVLLRSLGLTLVAFVAVVAALARTVWVGGPIPTTWWFALAGGLGAWLLYKYEDWRNDLYILTDDHIVDVERKPWGLFGERRQARLAQIQDIRHVVPNPLATLLDFGDVIVETAGETGQFTFDRVHDPAGVHEEIFARIERQRERERRAEEGRQADTLAQWFKEYHRLAGGAALPSNAPGTP